MQKGWPARNPRCQSMTRVKARLRMCKVRCSKTTLLGAVLCCLGLLECLRRVHEAEEDILMPSLNVSSAKIQKILLLAYARSGSSYTGELLSALPSAAYFWEPLIKLPAGASAAEVEDLLQGIFSCSRPVLQQLQEGRHPSVWKKGRDCTSSNPRLVKTIRLRRAGLEPWIQQEDIKVVHLVRDPRAMFSSILQRPDIWGEPYSQCGSMLDDMKLNASLPRERYMLVRYEDLVTSPTATLQSVYSYLGLPWTHHVREAVDSHSHAENSTDKKGDEYYSTFRSKYFRHDSWKQRLKPDQISAIEKECGEFMKRAGYSLHLQGRDQQKDLGSVSCGSHKASSCAECGPNASLCHGDCQWKDGTCRTSE